MLRKIVAAVILMPLAVIIIAFAMANRANVTVSFDPFRRQPAASVTLPLFALVILLLILGVVIGGVASRLRHGKWRGTARRVERELQRLRGNWAALEKHGGQADDRPGTGQFAAAAAAQAPGPLAIAEDVLGETRRARPSRRHDRKSGSRFFEKINAPRNVGAANRFNLKRLPL